MGLCRVFRWLWLRCIRCEYPSCPDSALHLLLVLNVILISDSTLAAGALALKLSVDAETVLFAVLDIVTQGLVGYWLLMAHDSATGMYVIPYTSASEDDDF